MFDQDTIAAIATAPGRGGIGVVRVSGALARMAVARVLTVGELEGRRATFARIVDEAGAVVDEAVVTYFPGPHSYTGEDVVEVATHGSPVVLDYVLGGALRGGARLARAGEFTERAFLHGRLDLTQAEAVKDLIEATTLHQARLAAEQLGGGLSRRVGPVKQALVELIAGLEAGIDFAEDDIDVMGDGEILRRMGRVEAELRELEATFRYGRVVHGGVTLAIVGAPNVGKSSLFNRLVDRDRAIVTAVAGTTRDVIGERVAIGGIPVELLDTAGLRVAADEVEALGIARTWEVLAEADLILFVTDGTGGEIPEEMAGRACLRVWNKADLFEDRREGGIWTSAVTGEGIEGLRKAIAGCLREGPAMEGGVLTNRRQHEAVGRALRGVEEAREAVGARVPHEMVMMNLYEALGGVDDLTGRTTSEDVLGVIFSTFCIGK